MKQFHRDKFWAILPARGGSKGVKFKNLKRLGKFPLIAHTLKNLKKSRCFSKIIVTSDNSKIIKISQNYKVDTHERINKTHSNDHSMSELPVIEVLENIDQNKWPKFIFMTSCTAPFIKPSTYKKAIKILEKNPNGTVFAAHESHYFLWKEGKKGKNKKSFLPISHPFKKRLGRQFIPLQLNETGAFYGFKTKNFMKAKHRFFSEAFPCKLQGFEIVDINNMNDWNYAEYVINNNEIKSNK